MIKYLDVRNYDEGEKNLDHINIPLNEIKKFIKEDKLDKDVEYKVYCVSGARARQATLILLANGYKAEVEQS